MIAQILSGKHAGLDARAVGYLIISLFLLSLFFSEIPYVKNTQGQVLGTASARANLYGESPSMLSQKIVMATTTNFGDKVEPVTTPIPYELKVSRDADMEYGEEKILAKGVLGEQTDYYKITYWKGQEVARELIETKIVEPVAERVLRGTKVIWRELNTEIGKVKYWRKMHVWATKYDANCYGCLGRTYSGTKVQKGVCAVDPKVMPMGTYFYVEGYGLCHAEDIGGAIKGNKIDLGYENAATAPWGAAWTNIYLMSSAPM